MPKDLMDKTREAKREDDVVWGMYVNLDKPELLDKIWDRGFDAGAASVDRVEVVGVDRSAVLTMIQAAKEGDWERFDSYARFGGGR